MTSRKTNNVDSFNTLIHSSKPVLVDFYASWCAPCQTLAPILKRVKDMVGDEATIIKVDVDKNRQAAAAYQVKSVPTMMLFKKGLVLWRQSGIVPADELVLLLKQYR